ncbi:MAG: PKD domain-containing protein, partial [Anaerolineales bacterium]
QYNLSVELVCTKADGTTETWTGSFTLTIEFQQTTPIVNAGADVSIDEGGTFTASGSFVDPDSSSWSARVDYGTGEGELELVISADNTFSLNQRYEDNGQYLVTVTVEDNEGNQGIATLTVTVNNLAPVISEITMDQVEVFEGTLVNFSANASDAGDDSLTYTWNFGDGSTGSGQDTAHQYLDNGKYTLVLTVTDDEGASTTKTLSIDVLNVAPLVEAGSPFTINTDQTFNGLGSFTDPGADNWIATVDYGDGTVQALTLNSDKSFGFGHAYASEMQYTVTITIDDGDDIGTDTMVVDVDDSLQVDENMTLNGMILTPGGFGLPCAYFGICTEGLEFTLPKNVADNDRFMIINHFNQDQPELSYAELFFIGPQDLNRIEYNISVELVCKKADGSTETWTGSFTITAELINMPPEITAIHAPIDPVELGTSIEVSAEFIDPDPSDSHTALWDWGDGSTNAGVIDNGAVSGSHTYQSPGVFILTLTVIDSGGAYDTNVFQYLVIFDPSSGFVTGGGWIISPPGAYTADPSLTGKASFGFVSKYKKGANLPTGNTEFQFKVGGLNFKSTVYDWLVIAGKKAMFKGVGTINGAGSYGFMISAIDDTVDKFRIKIWELESESVVYDNQLGSAEDADPSMVIEGGSIVIHNAK